MTGGIDMKSAYIITTHNPDENLVTYVESLISECVSQIVIVNEASDAEYQPIYDMLAMYPGCTVLSYAMSGEAAFVKALTWCDTHLSPYGYTDVIRVEYANETQREDVRNHAAAEAARPAYVVPEKRVRVEFIDACDKMIDRIGQCHEVLKEWQPMRRRQAAMA